MGLVGQEEIWIEQCKCHLKRDEGGLTVWNVENSHSTSRCSRSWTYSIACSSLFVLVLYPFCYPQVLGTWRRLHEYSIPRHTHKQPPAY